MSYLNSSDRCGGSEMGKAGSGHSHGVSPVLSVAVVGCPPTVCSGMPWRLQQWAWALPGTIRWAVLCAVCAEYGCVCIHVCVRGCESMHESPRMSEHRDKKTWVCM